MPIECRKDNDELVWVRNPFTRTITYFTHLHKKRSGFSRRAQTELLRSSSFDEAAAAAHLRAELEEAQRHCPFCPGNEHQTPAEVLRIPSRAVFPERSADDWLIRSVPNLIPRIPECCTGGRNESYVVIEDPRHFSDNPQRHEDLLYSALLPQAQFEALLAADVEVARLAYSNPAVKTVLIRKNQGRESGASQPHLHNQVIGSDVPFSAVTLECEVTSQEPRIWEELVYFAREHGFLLDEQDGCCAYFSPFGVFPHSYEVVCLRDRSRCIDVPAPRWRAFAALLYGVLTLLGPIPLDYEIHEGPGVPLHAHVNARHFPYSNIGGTLNLPSTLAASIRQARSQRGG